MRACVRACVRARRSAVQSSSGQRAPAQKVVATHSAPSETRAGAVGSDQVAPAQSESQAVAAAAVMEPAAAPPSELVSEEGRNRKAVLCQRCGSRVLQPGTALFSRRQVGRPGAGLEPQGLGPVSLGSKSRTLILLLMPAARGRKWRQRGFGKLAARKCRVHPVSTTCGPSPGLLPTSSALMALHAGDRGPAEDRDAQYGVGRRCPSCTRGVRAAFLSTPRPVSRTSSRGRVSQRRLRDGSSAEAACGGGSRF